MNFTSSKSRYAFLVIYLYTRVMIVVGRISSCRYYYIDKNCTSILLNSYNGMSDDIYLNRLLLFYKGNNVIIVGKDVRFYSPKYFYFLFTSRVWLTNTSMLYTTSFKPSGVKYINTWHGVPLIRAGNAVSELSYFDFSKVDLMPIVSGYQLDLYPKIFKVRQGALRPIRDLRIKDADVSNSAKYLFYAPSWRSNTSENKYLDESDLLEIAKKLNLILRISVHHKSNISYSDKFLLKRSVDRLEILRSSGLFVSDYSSLIFDAVTLSIPVSIHIPDYNEVQLERGFNLSLEGHNVNSLESIGDLEGAVSTTKVLRANFNMFVKSSTGLAKDYLPI